MAGSDPDTPHHHPRMKQEIVSYEAAASSSGAHHPFGHHPPPPPPLETGSAFGHARAPPSLPPTSAHHLHPSPISPFHDHHSAPPSATYPYSLPGHAAPIDAPHHGHHGHPHPHQHHTHPPHDSAASRPGPPPPPPGPSTGPSSAGPLPSPTAHHPPYRRGSLPSPHEGQPHHPMAHPATAPYGPPDGHVNGTIPPHGMAHPDVGHAPPFGSGSYAHPVSYGASNPAYYAPPNAPARKKPVRATQACDNCRQRKQKCDEARPCQFCAENHMKCDYREVPPPKQDRAMAALMEKLAEMSEDLKNIKGKVAHIPDPPPSSATLPSTSNAGPAETPGASTASNSGHGDTPHASDPRDTSMPPPYSHAAEHRLHNNSSPMNISQGPPPLTSDRNLRDSVRADNSQLTIPYQHSTPAHKLLSIWKSIGKFTENVNVSSNYPLEVEYERGLLRVHGSGEGRDTGVFGRNVPSSPSRSSDTDDGASPAREPEHDWGTYCTWGPDWHQPMPAIGSSHTGARPVFRLTLDEISVRKLHDSFMRNLWVLHPFLEKSRLNKMINRFIRRHAHRGLPAPASTPGERVGTKRKRDGLIYVPHGAADTEVSQEPLPPEPIKRTVSNAIVLLVLALGDVCEHDDPLPGLAPPVDRDATVTSSPRFQHPATPPVAIKQSPSSTTGSSVSSPNAPGLPMTGLPRPSGSAPPPDRGDSQSNGAFNKDFIPGLAYYSYAADILGSLHGGLELSHTQAFLLAGLYMGQLARVLESWSWINAACRACQVLLQIEGVVEPPSTADDSQQETRTKEQSMLSPGQLARQDMVRLAFWTCLQLESDILAELDQLPHSGISRFEDRVKLPTGVYSDMPPAMRDNDHEVMMLYYSAQIQLRKILNQVHSSLYKKVPEPTQDGSFEDEPEFKTYEHLTWLLNQWRQILPPGLQWHDEEPPPPNINVARMRAKYYGALYVINRPYLYQALHSSRSKSGKDGNTGANDAATTCIKAAKRSTIAFDGLRTGRFIITNPFGTLHAQFGNCLVLTAVHQCSSTFHHVSRVELDTLLARTVNKLRDWAPMSAALKKDAEILTTVTENIKEVKWVLQGGGSSSGSGGGSTAALAPGNGGGTSANPRGSQNPSSANSSFTNS